MLESKLEEGYIVEETECFSHGFWSGQQEEPKKNPYEAGTEDYTEYENGYMQGVMTRRRMQVESHVEFRIDHRDKLTGDHKSTFTKHDAKVSDTTDKATYVKVPSHKADSFKSAMKGHGAKVELAEARSPQERLAVAKQMYDSAMKSARTPAERAQAKETYDNVVKRLREQLELAEGRGSADKYWDEAEDHKEEAKKHKVGTEAHHSHMANHYDAMHRYHSDIGQHSEASKAADKAEMHHEKAYEASKANEEVAANNVGGGSIAGTQGDAGKKVKMMSEPLKRKPMPRFKTYVSQEHENA
jgi:hypothetical protein